MDQWQDRIEGLDADFVLLGHTHVQGMRTFGDFVFPGHTHVQGIRTFGRTTVVNPGSVGLARDHRGEACYAVFQDGEVELKRIRYDVERTVRAMRAAPLPTEVIEGLAGVLSGSK